MKKKKTNVIFPRIIGVLLIIAIFLGAVAWYRCIHNTEVSTPASVQPPSQDDLIHDANVVTDLYALETAIIKYYHDSIAPAKEGTQLLPASLNDLSAQDLRGSLSDYSYSYESRTSGGGPTVIFTLCATFKTRSDSLDSPSHEPGRSHTSPEAYEYHDKDWQCFENAYYKGGSHIEIVNR